MSAQITLTIPDNVYQKPVARAKSTQRAVADLLLDSVIADLDWPKPEWDEKHQAMAREEAAFRALHVQLYAKYPEQFVAIYQGKLVDYDPDPTALFERIDKQYPEQVVLMTKVRATPDEVYTVRSPRIVHDSR